MICFGITVWGVISMSYGISFPPTRKVYLKRPLGSRVLLGMVVVYSVNDGLLNPYFLRFSRLDDRKTLGARQYLPFAFSTTTTWRMRLVPHATIQNGYILKFWILVFWYRWEKRGEIRKTKVFMMASQLFDELSCLNHGS